MTFCYFLTSRSFGNDESMSCVSAYMKLFGGKGGGEEGKEGGGGEEGGCVHKYSERGAGDARGECEMD